MRYYDYYFDANLPQKALHNLFFEVVCENGILAAIIYFTYFLYPWYSVWRSREALLGGDALSCALALSVLAGIPGYFLSSMFSSGSLIETSYVLTIIGCGVLAFPLAGTTGRAEVNAGESPAGSRRRIMTERNAWLDTLRASAIIAVVSCHASAGFSTQTGTPRTGFLAALGLGGHASISSLF